FDVEWIRDIADAANAPPMPDDQVAAEIEDVYCDPGFRDGVLFNASSDRLPAKLNIDAPAWLRVTVRIPEPDPKLTIVIRALSEPADSPVAVVAIVPSNRLTFRSSNAASFVIRPQHVGHFTLHFISEGSHARYYHPIPSRSMVVEGQFMRQTLQLAWKKRADESKPNNNQPQPRARHMFGMDSQPTKSHWVRCIDAALKGSPDLPSKDVLRNVERATNALDQAQQPPSDQGITCQQLLAALLTSPIINQHIRPQVFSDRQNATQLAKFEAAWKTIRAFHNTSKAHVDKTPLPAQLVLMFDLLVQEDIQQTDSDDSTTGACMEYLLGNNILDELVRLAERDQPLGIRGVVISNLSTFVSLTDDKLLVQKAVHNPILELLRSYSAYRSAKSSAAGGIAQSTASVASLFSTHQHIYDDDF
ncbi:hypothetical protein GGI21_005388, partial [Coemansia aciculifera]